MLTPTPQPEIKPASRPEEHLTGPLPVATLDTPVGARVRRVIPDGREGTVLGRNPVADEGGLMVQWDGHPAAFVVQPEALFCLPGDPETVELTPAAAAAMDADDELRRHRALLADIEGMMDRPAMCPTCLAVADAIGHHFPERPAAEAPRTAGEQAAAAVTLQAKGAIEELAHLCDALEGVLTLAATEKRELSRIADALERTVDLARTEHVVKSDALRVIRDLSEPHKDEDPLLGQIHMLAANAARPGTPDARE